MKYYLFIFFLFITINIYAFDLPESYNTDINHIYEVSPVRDQKGLGSCWAFAPCGSMEACAIKRYGKADILSPLNIVNKNPYPNLSIYKGGSYDKTMAYLFQLIGPVEEKSDPYKPPYSSPTTQPTPCGYSEDVYILSDDNGGFDEEELNSVKMAVGIYGGVVVSYFDDERNYYSSDRKNYFCPYTNHSNHQIVIIGWDDNYSKKHFRHYPKKDGAFLAKGSWGTKINKGFEWISYEDANLSNAVCYTYSKVEDVPYKNILSYVKSSAVDTYFYPKSQDVYGKVLYDNLDCEIKALRAYIPEKSECKIMLYVDDILKYEETKEINWGGFKTFYLDSSVKVEKKNKVAFVIRFTGKDKYGTLPVEMPDNEYKAVLKKGCNFVSWNGRDWKEAPYNIGVGILY